MCSTAHRSMYEFPGGILESELLSSVVKAKTQPESSQPLNNLNRIREKYVKGYL